MIESGNGIGCRHEDQFLALGAHHALVPVASEPNKLMDRKRIEKFIGDQKERRIVGHLAQILSPYRLDAREGFRLNVTQNGTGLYQHNLSRGTEIGPDLGRAQQIRHQRAASRAQLHQMKSAGPAAVLPRLHKKQPDQFAEDLAHFRRGDEIAPQRIAPHVIAAFRIGEGDRHIVRDADRSLRADETKEFFLRCVHGVALAGWRSAYQKKNAAAAHIGRLSNWPMLNQP